MNTVDQSAVMYLVELALYMAKAVQKLKGNFVAKVFQAECFDQYLANVRTHFKRVVTRKPDSSRSRDVYISGFGYQ